MWQLCDGVALEFGLMLLSEMDLGRKIKRLNRTIEDENRTTQRFLSLFDCKLSDLAEQGLGSEIRVLVSQRVAEQAIINDYYDEVKAEQMAEIDKIINGSLVP